MCPVLSTACPNGHVCAVGNVSLGIWDRVCGGSECVFLLQVRGGGMREEDNERLDLWGEHRLILTAVLWGFPQLSW